MPFSLTNAPEELKTAIDAMETRADDCYKLLRLLKRPANEASWALLTAMAVELETRQQKYGVNSSHHKIAMVRLDRNTCGFKFISEHGKPASQLVRSYTWHGSLIEDARFALYVTEQYSHFLGLLPMWRKGYEQAELLPEGRIRFFIPNDSPRQRQVIAFQQGYSAPGFDTISPYRDRPKAESPSAMRLLNELFHVARPGGVAKKFAYDPSGELIDALRPKYQQRLDENFRRSDSFQLNGYSLGQFKSFYIAFLILCSIHEYICYPFDKPGQPIPTSSLVMVKSRSAWIATLSGISGLPEAICRAIISDLTLDPIVQAAASMCIHPFVPLDPFQLAVAPQFPLASAVDDNILRSFSYTFPALFSAQNTDKETLMRERVVDVAISFSVGHSIELPSKRTEIDLVLSDEASSTVVFAELKWGRKPNRSLERVERNNVHYLLVAWDHWYWIEPGDGIAIVAFDAFLSILKRHRNLQAFVAELLQYHWLPAEGRDFRVSYAISSVNGAAFESPIISPA